MKTIREARKATGLSQAAAAKALGIPFRTWQNWELGQRTPPDYVARLIIKELEQMSKSTH